MGTLGPIIEKRSTYLSLLVWRLMEASSSLQMFSEEQHENSEMKKEWLDAEEAVPSRYLAPPKSC